MNDDLISREAVKKQLKAKIDLDQDDEFTIGYNIGISACVELIDNAPTVKAFTVDEVREIRQATMEQVRISCKQNERPQGEWKLIQGSSVVFGCSCCNIRIIAMIPYNFCPNCGANMKQD